MSSKRSLLTSFAHKTALIISMVLAISIAVFAQDPTGRPKDPKKKNTPGTTKKQPVKPLEPPSVTLTVLTTPVGSTVLLNGEERGVTSAEGKVQFDKLPLGHYNVEVRKDGYNAVTKGFEAGTESPTLVFKLEPKLDDFIREFNDLVTAGKLTGPSSPNAFELLEKLTTNYGDRPEVSTLKTVLAAKLGETITPVIVQTATNWRTVTREQITQAQDLATNALVLNKDDKRIQAQAAYLRGAIALRNWQSAGSTPKPDGGQGDAAGSVAGPATARTEFENASRLDDTLVAARYQLGVVLLASGDFAGAEGLLVKVTQQEPRWIHAYIRLGHAYSAGAKYTEAIDAYRKANAIEPNNATPIAGIGLARFMKGEKDGFKDIDRAVKLDASNPYPHLSLGIYYSQSKSKKDWPKAEDELKKAIQMNSQNLEFQNATAERLLADVQKKKK
jgi:tetratricopeptide (TPR) repeat protein